MEVMLIDWTSSAKRSSVISSMIASMDSVWLTTAVQMIFCTPVWNGLRRETAAASGETRAWTL